MIGLSWRRIGERWQRMIAARRTARAHRALRELSEATLVDIGAPPWLWREARRRDACERRRGVLEREGLGFVQWRW